MVAGMIFERRAEPRALPMAQVSRPVCIIIKGLKPPTGKGIYLAYSNAKKGVVIGADYMDAFFRYYGVA